MKQLITISIIFFIAGAYPALAQSDQEVSGTITDASRDQTIPGVNIREKGASVGTSTDFNGKYSLKVESLQDSLIFSFVGYQTKTVAINGQTTINVALETQTFQGQEMVVVGYGEQKKENLTGSVSSIEGANISNEASLQVSSALIGKAAGVTVTQNSGQPGSDTGNISIRGIGTLGNSDPLILIDGVPGNLSDVAPSNIASVSVLKDAASAAIYGTRAANGVVLVKTKRGKKGTVQVSYNGYVGWQQPANQPNFVGAGEYMKYANLASTNIGREPIYSQDYISQWQANHVNDPDHYPNTDWVDAVFTEQGFQQKQHVNVSGGSANFQYLGSLSYDNQKGNIANFGYKRYNLRLNTDINISEQWHFSFDINGIRKDQRAPSGGLFQITKQTYRLPPLLVAQYSDGSLGPGRNHRRNPAAFVQEGGLDTHNGSIFKSRLQARYNPFDGLEFTLRYSPEYRDSFNKSVQKQVTLHDISTPNTVYNAPSVNSLSESDDKTFNNNVDFTINYQKSIDNHLFKLLGGYEFINHHYDTFSAYRDKLSLQNFEQLNVGSLDNQQNSGTASAYALQSIFGRLNYEYKSKYLFEANLRYDGSSRFAEDNRYGLFPSFSAGWIISNEAFLDDLNSLSTLKIRASWGKLGNQEIGTYPYQAVINLSQSFLFGGVPTAGAAQLDLANPQISWETTKTADVGLDMGLWEDRFNFSFDYYQKKTDDILLQLPVPLIIGLNAPYQNAGAVENTGWELSSYYQNNIGDFQYNLGLNISNVHNEITDLRGAGPFISGNRINKVGYPINSIYGFEADGYFDSQEEIDNSAKQTGNIAPGDIKYKDQLTIDTNGDGVPDEADGVINSQDKTIIGNPFPRYSYGINIGANYKGFDLSASFQGVGKKDILLQQDAVWAFYNGGKIREWQKDFWTPDNKNAAYPRLVSGTTENNFKPSSHWTYNASYLRLRNLQLGYTLPVEWTSALSIKKLRIYFLGQNLFSGLDNMPPGVSPNVPNDTNGGYYPITKVYTFGLNLNF